MLGLMSQTQPTDSASSETGAPKWERRWLFPLLRILLLVFAAWLVWYTAGHWDRWTGAARFESTDDAFVSGDVTPLSARVSGNITEMPVNDFQIVRKGDLLAVIDPSDYEAQLELAQANLATQTGLGPVVGTAIVVSPDRHQISVALHADVHLTLLSWAEGTRPLVVAAVASSSPRGSVSGAGCP